MSRACSPPATSRTTPTAKPSRRPAPAARPPSTPNAGSRPSTTGSWGNIGGILAVLVDSSKLLHHTTKGRPPNGWKYQHPDGRNVRRDDRRRQRSGRRRLLGRVVRTVQDDRPDPR